MAVRPGGQSVQRRRDEARRRGYANLTYAVEDYVFKSKSGKWLNEPITIHDARRRLDQWGLWWVEVQPARAGSRASYSYFQSRRICLAPHHGLWILIHEAAHQLANLHGEHGHGPVFRREYLRLVHRVLGEWWRVRLAAGFKAFGLTVADPH